MPRPTEKDILKAFPSGAYILPCNGEHAIPNHVYYFYTKKEIIQKWRMEHPVRKGENG